MNRSMLIAAAILVTLPLSACFDSKTTVSKSNFKEVLQTYYNDYNGSCITPPASAMPFELEMKPIFTPPSGITLLARADALVDAGLLSRTENPAKKTFVYDMTAEGQKYLKVGAGTNRRPGDAFCTGTMVVKEVLTYTEPAEFFGFRVSEVTFSHSGEDLADWVKTPTLIKANPEYEATMRGGVATSKAMLRLTSEGWIHDKTKAKS